MIRGISQYEDDTALRVYTINFLALRKDYRILMELLVAAGFAGVLLFVAAGLAVELLFFAVTVNQLSFFCAKAGVVAKLNPATATISDDAIKAIV